MNYKEMQKYWEERAEYKVICRCGHTMTMPPRIDKKICRWCGNYVFKNKKDEFKYRLNEKMNKQKTDLPK